MHKIKLLVIISIVIAAMTLTGVCGADENTEEQDMRSMSGNITEIDTFNSTITVKWQDLNLIGYNFTTFTIPEGMTFYKRGETADITDLNIGDPVTIAYYTDKNAVPKIVRLEVGED